MPEVTPIKKIDDDEASQSAKTAKTNDSKPHNRNPFRWFLITLLEIHPFNYKSSDFVEYQRIKKQEWSLYNKYAFTIIDLIARNLFLADRNKSLAFLVIIQASQYLEEATYTEFTTGVSVAWWGHSHAMRHLLLVCQLKIVWVLLLF